ncbi:TonB-dependent receptor [Vibrio hannami]|uniref:TonB-dependent receptor plug domain-containing protein n=1 Tax=Vibrio hannami TaxID=2717094 RepID=UPI00240F2922|nr:TonB-dependent receptor [Vibrio hannami]MDG3085763.1 TonB-dependent receptor [Vibrio hannami]
MRLYRMTVLSSLLLPYAVLASDVGDSLLDLDSLMASDVQLSSVMKRLQSANETAASVYVLSGEEIRRSGVSSIPQALTLVPGIQARKIDKNLWAITSRAVASRYSSKLLVMVDGRSVYDVVHVGVNWEALDIPLYDIERIEVVRGQGALLWGSNATNGVINIITKHTEDTRGLTVQGSLGDQINHNVGVSYGKALDKSGSYRVHAVSREHNASDRTEFGSKANDSSSVYGIGGRLDLNLSERLFMLFQAGYQETKPSGMLEVPELATFVNHHTDIETDRKDSFFSGKIEHSLDSRTTQAFQFSYSFVDSKSIFFEENQKQFDADYQLNTEINQLRFDMGLNYQYIDLAIEDTAYVSQINNVDALEHYGAFLQAEYELIPQTLNLTIGNKSEHNSITGWEHQPMLKMVWMPDIQHTFWTSVSQGVRIPSLAEYDFELLTKSAKASYIIPGLDTQIKSVLRGNEDIDAEKSVSQEFGYRFIDHSFSLDLSGFYTKSRDVPAIDTELGPHTVEQLLGAYQSDLLFGTNFLPGLLSSSTINYSFVSGIELNTYGGELLIAWQATENLKTEFSYSYTNYEYELGSQLRSAVGFDSELQHWLAKAIWSVNSHHSLYSIVRHERGEAYGTNDFTAIDVSWSWQIDPNLLLSITGNNLFYGDKVEYSNEQEAYEVPSYIEPSITARINIDF